MRPDVDLSAGASAQPGARAIARLLAWAPGRWVALPPHTTLEVIERPQPVAVPGAPRHALGLLAWQRQWLPMIDLRALLENGAPASTRPPYALIVAWQPAPGARVAHGALALDALPETVSVEDRAACPLPQDDGIEWTGRALACFSHSGRPVPILDTGSLLNASQ